jgi:hypothetical protein
LPSLEAEEVEMMQDSRFPRVSVKAAPTPANMPSSSLRPQRNRPATIDEFEREHMGIAAKE